MNASVTNIERQADMTARHREERTAAMRAAAATTDAPRALDPRTRRLLEAPILPLLLGMAWPNTLVMLAQAATGLIETWWLSRLGTDALAGMALVFPPVMLMTMISAGAVGSGVSSAIARALGRGDRIEADDLVLHAVVINLVLALLCSFIFLTFGETIYRTLGGQGGELDAALSYSNVIFATNLFLWQMNGLASVIRGTGNMWFPALVTITGVVLLIPLSPLLIFGFGPVPALGVAGGGLAVALFNVAGTIAMAWYILSGRNAVKFRWTKLRRAPLVDILRVGSISALMTTLTTITASTATAMVAAAGGAVAVAGFGTGIRLEYLLIPMIFGIGAPLIALVGTNIGAGNKERAMRIGLVGGALAFALTETVGIAAAIWPERWLLLFSADADMLATGSDYLRIVGPVYGFFGLGLAMYFASQGAGRLFWPFVGGFSRILLSLGGGWLALYLTGSLSWLFAALAAGMAAYGSIMLVAVSKGAWFR